MLLLKKRGLPEESELVLCTVGSVQHHSVFVTLDEYGLNGMIHISEVSPGRIRNIRDFVKEGKIVVCKVLRVNKERGQVDLSLRRVTESQKRSKINETKQEQKAEKIIENVATKLKKDPKKLFEELVDRVLAEFPTVFGCFSEIAEDRFSISKLKLDKDVSQELEVIIKQRIKPAEVAIKGDVKLVSYGPDGVETIKAALKKIIDGGSEVSYVKAGQYRITVRAANYKIAEQIIERAAKDAISFVSSKDGFGEFERVEG